MSDETTLQEVESIALPFIQQLLLAQAVNAIQKLVATDETRFPGDTIAALTTQVDGDLAHQVRVQLGVLGFLVDLGWNNPTLQGGLTTLIQAGIAAYPPNPAPATAESVA